MKKLILGLIFACFASSELFALKAVLVCRTSGLSYKTLDTVSIDCGNISSFECEKMLENSLKRHFNEYDAYDAEKKVCYKIQGSWYPDKIKIIY